MPRLGALVLLLALTHAPALADPRTDYMLHCMGCHQPTGEAATGKVPALKGEVGRMLVLPGGRDYLLRVPGVAQSQLSDERLALLMNWLVETYGELAGRRPVPFSASEVGRLRRRPLPEPLKARSALLAGAAVGRR